MINEHWSQWRPVDGLAEQYYIDGVLDTKEGFKIELAEEESRKKVFVTFKNSVDSYRSTYETFRCKLVSQLGDKYDSYFYKWSLFKVENSSYIQLLSKQSQGNVDMRNMIHFVFMDINYVLDVVATYEPIVEIVNEL